MLRRSIVSILALAVGSLLAGGAPARQANPQAQGGGGLPSQQADSGLKAPSDAEVRERAAKLAENQHNDDAALEQYERVEHYVDRTNSANSRVILDKTYRVVPTGGGTMKILLTDRGMPGDPNDYRRQLQVLQGILEMMANPNDPKAKAAYEKYRKRQLDRVQFVDVARNAFVVKWQDGEVWNGRPCDVFALSPDPNFHPRSMFQDALAHVTAKIWVDRETGQLARGEADITSDVYFGGGLLGRLSRGSKVSMEQAEVAPGIWLPTRYQYDFSGRKFLFSFEEHQAIEAGHYRRIGPPSEALLAVRNELTNGKPAAGDP